MGGFRSWQVAALSDHIAAAAAICWMTTVKGVMVPGNLAVLHGKLMPQDGDPGILVVWCGTDAHQSENVAARGERRG